MLNMSREELQEIERVQKARKDYVPLAADIGAQVDNNSRGLYVGDKLQTLLDKV